MSFHFASLDPATLIFAMLVLILAGFVKGVIGLGLPTIGVGLLGLVMAPIEAAALLVVPNLVTNVWQLVIGPDYRALIRRLWPMMAGIAAGTLAGAWVLPAGISPLATALLGALLVVYAVVGLKALRFHVAPRREPVMGPLIGAVTGVVTVATGVFVLPAVPYLQALGLDKDDLVQALGLSFLTSTISLAIVLGLSGQFTFQVAGSSLAALVPALAGMYLGQAMRSRIAAATFRRWFFLGLLALGLYLIGRQVL
jgi:hypothetical protein